MLTINRAVKPKWQLIKLTTIHRAAPGPGQLPAIPGGAGLALWVPPEPGLISAYSVNSTAIGIDQLVGAGGATTLAIGVTPAAVFVNALALASYSTQLAGWGVNGPSVAAGIVGIADQGVVVHPIGTLPDLGAAQRVLQGFANAGTITGTLHHRFLFQPLGSWL